MTDPKLQMPDPRSPMTDFRILLSPLTNRGPGGKLYVTYDIARQFPGYGAEAGASSSEFADRIIHHINRA